MNFAFLVDGVSEIYPAAGLTECVSWHVRMAASWQRFWLHHSSSKA